MTSDLNSSLNTLFGKMDNFVSSKTVVGEPVHIGEVIMLPLVDVTFGVGASNVNKSKEDKASTDAGGLGAKITPSAVIVIKGDTVQLVNVKNQDAVSKLIDMAPGILSKFDLGNIISNFTSKDEKTSKSDKADEDKETVYKETKTVTETIVKEAEEE